MVDTTGPGHHSTVSQRPGLSYLTFNFKPAAQTQWMRRDTANKVDKAKETGYFG